MKARLARYAPVQLLDYFIERGAVTLAMGALFGWMMIVTNGERGPRWWEGENGLVLIKAFLAATLGLFTVFGTLTAVNGMISNDRVKGTFRFLFAKPVSVPRYYAQAWLIHGIGLMLVVTTLLLAFALIVRPFFPPMILAYVATMYVLLGGIGFLLSALTKRDGTLLVAIWLISLVIRAKYSGSDGFTAGVVRFVTPPANEMSGIVNQIMLGNPIDYTAIWTALAYGLICVAAGLVVLRYRPMTS